MFCLRIAKVKRKKKSAFREVNTRIMSESNACSTGTIGEGLCACRTAHM